MKLVKTSTRALFAMVLAGATSPSTAQTDYPEGFDLGPSSVPAELSEVTEARKEASFKGLTFPSLDEYGLSLGADYNVLYQRVSDSPGDDLAAGGVARLYGIWTPLNQGSPDAGKFVFKAEHRHRLATDLAPSELLPTSGVAGISGPTFSDKGMVLTNFYWKEAFADNRFAVIAGVIDVADYADVYGLTNVWTEFNNLAFSTNPTMPVPAQGLGAAVRWNLTPRYYAVGSIADANGDPHDPGDFFHSFFGVAEYFKHIEFGRIGSWENRSADNLHITLWEVDAREQAGIGKDQGVALSWSLPFDKWLPFLRGGYADHGVAVLKKTVSAGTGYTLNGRGDYVGIGVNWGRAADSDIDQYTIETYYRPQIFKRLQITPSAQYIIDPAYSSSQDSLWLFAFRMRATF